MAYLEQSETSGQPPLPIPAKDEDLVAAARAGSRDAFEILVRRYQRTVYSFCRRFVAEHDLAADLTQRTFLRAMEHIADLREGDRFRSWLFSTASHLALNHRRDNARLVSRDNVDSEVAAAAPALMEQAELSATLQRAVSALPPKQRMVVQLRVYQELSFSDLARELGVTPNAARVCFHFAVKSLRGLLPRTAIA